MTDNRKLELEVEVPGTPEQVWDAIATGPGITAWFARAEVEERDGGAISFDLGGGIESSGVVIAFEPPHRFVYEEPLEDDARLASEWLVEARSGGTCIVRLVSSLFGSSADWEDELGGMEDGWRSYMQNLRLYLTHFAGQACSPVNVSGDGTGSLDETWAQLTAALGLSDAAVGERVSASAPGAPRLAGTVERRTGGEYHHDLLLHLTEPAPGTAFLLAYRYQERVSPAIRAYLFGADAPTIASREEASWRAWMDERFAASNAA
jgi:uncharacterized protein YndB with AHSA1/START domain